MGVEVEVGGIHSETTLPVRPPDRDGVSDPGEYDDGFEEDEDNFEEDFENDSVSEPDPDESSGSDVKATKVSSHARELPEDRARVGDVKTHTTKEYSSDVDDEQDT